jgi:hypothetical protein
MEDITRFTDNLVISSIFVQDICTNSCALIIKDQ